MWKHQRVLYQELTNVDGLGQDSMEFGEDTDRSDGPSRR